MREEEIQTMGWIGNVELNLEVSSSVYIDIVSSHHHFGKVIILPETTAREYNLTMLVSLGYLRGIQNAKSPPRMPRGHCVRYLIRSHTLHYSSGAEGSGFVFSISFLLQALYAPQFPRNAWPGLCLTYPNSPSCPNYRPNTFVYAAKGLASFATLSQLSSTARLVDPGTVLTWILPTSHQLLISCSRTLARYSTIWHREKMR